MQVNVKEKYNEKFTIRKSSDDCWHCLLYRRSQLPQRGNIPGINITISPAPESETIPDKAGKYLWARIGVGFRVSDELHQKIKEAMFEDGPERVLELLDQAECSQDGDSYFPMDCRDNPNADWEFDF